MAEMIQLDPPGTWCTNFAFNEIVNSIKQVREFIEIGPGEGQISKRLCARGLNGYGIDFSDASIEILKKTMSKEICQGQYKTIKSDIMEELPETRAELVFSIMVMEHIEDDLTFLKRLRLLVRPGGYVITVVPGRKNKWGTEDELSGHFRRYNKEDIEKIYQLAEFSDITVWSANVPISNILFRLSNMAVKRSRYDQIKNLHIKDQTKVSGIRDIKYNNLFPPIFKLILNPAVMYPFHILQRFFYHTRLGTVMIGKSVVN